MKIIFNPAGLRKYPIKTLASITQQITSNAEQNRSIDAHSFRIFLEFIGEIFKSNNNDEFLNKKLASLAERLVGMKKNRLAGILYSYLIKFNQNNTNLVEEYAIKGIAVARKQKDDIHLLARYNDLNDIYRTREYGSKKHLLTLYNMKIILNHILEDYIKASNNYSTITRKMKPIDNYRFMMCSIKLEIARLIHKQYPKQALKELAEADNIINPYGNGTLSECIRNLTQKINTKQI